MPRWLAATTAAITRLNRIVFMLTIWLMAIVVPVMLYEVIARYVFDAPTVWGMELAVLLFGPYFLLGGPYLLHLRGPVSHDVARQRLKPRVNRRLDQQNLPVIIAFCLILLFFSTPAAISSFEYRETSFSAWNPPIWWAKAAVPISLALMLLQALAEFARTLYGVETLDQDEEPAAPETAL